ncbi:MAG: glycosyltransferase family 2 protein [Gemmatimonadales bacterium]
MSGTRLSVIVPAYNGAGVLEKSLSALRDSDLPARHWELIVVDDASTDDTGMLASQYADRVVRLDGSPHGPSYARNRATEVAKGDVAVFIDADVVVHKSTLRQFREVFDQQPEVAAAFGSYDDHPPASGLVSRYRNLYHHYVHHQNPGVAETFWAGCGAVRLSVFREVGMYNEWHFSRPQVEDIELGQRLNDHGFRIVLIPEIQATHLKHWTLRNMIAADLNDRGVPWTRLLIRRGTAIESKSLNLKTREKLKTALVGLASLTVLLAAWQRSLLWLAISGLLLGCVVLANMHLYRFFYRHGGWRLALATVPLNLLYYVINTVAAAWGWVLHHTMGDPQPPVAVEAMAEIGVDSWPPVPKKFPKEDAPSDANTVAADD